MEENSATYRRRRSCSYTYIYTKDMCNRHWNVRWVYTAGFDLVVGPRDRCLSLSLYPYSVYHIRCFFVCETLHKHKVSCRSQRSAVRGMHHMLSTYESLLWTNDTKMSVALNSIVIWLCGIWCKYTYGVLVGLGVQHKLVEPNKIHTNTQHSNKRTYKKIYQTHFGWVVYFLPIASLFR